VLFILSILLCNVWKPSCSNNLNKRFCKIKDWISQ